VPEAEKKKNQLFSIKCFFLCSQMNEELGLPLWWRKFTVAWNIQKMLWWGRNLWCLSRVIRSCMTSRTLSACPFF